MAENRVTGVAVEILSDEQSTARSTGVAVEVLVSLVDAPNDLGVDFEDAAELQALLTNMVEHDLSANFVDEALLVADVTMSLSEFLRVDFEDLAELSANLVAYTDVYISVNLSDRAEVRLRPLKIKPPVFLGVDFQDGAKFTAAVFQSVPANTGPFYFAWVNEDEVTFNSSFLRDDEDVFSFQLTQSEGDFAQLSATIRNPRIGLLAPGRKIWAWLSYFDGTTLKPIFFGRLVGIPSNIFDVLVTLEFVARPSDFAEQKEALAQTLRTAPHFDPLFVSPDHWDDPDVVLEARSALWHIDRVTHKLTVSDLLVPEDGVVEVSADDHLYDGLSVSMTSVPARRVRVEASIPWTQRASGRIKLSDRIKRVWETPMGPGTQGFSGMISSYTFEGLSGSWPTPGQRFGNGWTVVDGSLVNGSGSLVPSVFADAILRAYGFPFLEIDKLTRLTPGTAVLRKSDPLVPGVTTTVVVPMGWGVPVLEVEYRAERDFTEEVVIEIEADMQSILTMPGDEENIVLTYNANSASDISRDGAIPLRAPQLRSFSDTQRGLQSIEHLILCARAALINRSRAIRIDCSLVNFLDALNVTLRKSILLEDPRLPGGQAFGKVTRYNLSYMNGAPIAIITFQPAVGYGGEAPTSPGQDAYIDDSYYESGGIGGGYYVRDDHVIAVASDVSFEVPRYNVMDDGTDFTRGLNADSAVRSLVVTGGPRSQQQAIAEYVGASADIESVKIVLNELPTQVHADMTPVTGGPFVTPVAVLASRLRIPKQIDLEAS